MSCCSRGWTMSYGQNQNVKYGLHIPKKPGAPGVKSRPPVRPATSAFSLDDDDDEDEQLATKEGFNAMLRKQSQKSQKKIEEAKKAALDEDPSIYDYDGVYDEIQEQRNQQAQQALQRVETKQESRYIENLKRAAELKKMEQDRYYERRLAKERKEDDELYKDKDKYITSAYRKKMEEQKKWEMLDKLQEDEEKKNDVTKKGMDGFFSNLLTNNIAMGGDVKKSAKSAYTVGSKTQDMMLHKERPKTEQEEEEEERERLLAEVKREREEEEERRRERAEPQGESAKMVDPRDAKRKQEEPEGGEEEGGGKRPRAEEGEKKKPAEPPAAKEEAKDPEAIRREKEEAIKKARERFLARKQAGRAAS